MPVRTLTLTGLLAALLCICGPLTLPAGPVPLSLATAVMLLAALLLGCGRAALCVSVYLLMGLAGLPVFSGFAGGAGMLAGPTGGFLLGYLPMTALVGLVCSRAESRAESRAVQLLGMLAGTALLYAAGSAWYAWQTGVGLTGTLTVCVLPFLPGDALKIAAVLTAGNRIKARLKRAGLLR